MSDLECNRDFGVYISNIQNTHIQTITDELYYSVHWYVIIFTIFFTFMSIFSNDLNMNDLTGVTHSR